jgi:hypothetical protein
MVTPDGPAMRLSRMRDKMHGFVFGIVLSVVIAYGTSHAQGTTQDERVRPVRPSRESAEAPCYVYPPVQYPPADALKGFTSTRIRATIASQVGLRAFEAYVEAESKAGRSIEYPERKLEGFIRAAE